MYSVATNINEIKQYISTADKIALDIETSPLPQYRSVDKAALDAHMAEITGISISVAESSGVYIPIRHRCGGNADPNQIIPWMKKNILQNPGITLICHNISFETQFFYALGIVPTCKVYDTIAAAQMTLKGNYTFRNLSDSGLKTLVPQLLDVKLPTFGDVTGGKFFDKLDPVDTETIRYACADSDYTLRLYHLFNNWFDKWLPKQRFMVEKVESPAAVFTGIMKYEGLLVDAALMKSKSKETEVRLEKLREDISFIIGDVNIGANCSTSAFKQYLYQTLGLPVLKTTSKYQEAVDDETLILLSEWCEGNRPDLVLLFKLVQEYRKVGKINSTYIDGYQKHINNATGRIHTDFMPLATETGRFAARNPNLQNMPRSGADDVGVRNFFIAPEGKTLLSLDFSQIELRVGAFYCRDEKMIEIYQTGGDIHDQTATVIYGDGKHSKEQRTIAKNVNFGTFYGLFPSGLQKTLKFKANVNKSFAECETVISNLKAGYPKLTQWQEDTKVAARRNRYSETWLGRRRYLPDIASDNWEKRSFAQRCALNTPIQGTAADILKLALGRIIQGLPDRPWLKPLLQIHDELVFELPEDKVSEATTFIKQCMEQTPFSNFDVPITAEAAVGHRFGELKEVPV